MQVIIIGILILFIGQVEAQCFLDSTKIIPNGNLIHNEEKTASYYCVSRALGKKDTIPENIALGVKQYLFATIGNKLYKKLRLKHIEITDWSLLEEIHSSEPSKGKCKGISYLYTYALVFEDWIEYEIVIPVDAKGKVVSKGYYEPTIDIKTELKYNTYCEALSRLELEIGETVASIQTITIDYNAKTKAFDWVFTQTKRRVPVKRNIQDLEYNTVQMQYYIWTVSTLNGEVHQEFKVEED